MNLAVSNIAWTENEEPAVAAALQKLQVKYVEIAPTRVWPDPLHVSQQAIDTYKQFWAGYGIEIVAFQSMLFTRPDLLLFGSDVLRQETLTCLSGFVELAGRVGAGILVFGSPKNRRRESMSVNEALPIASTFFNALGDKATAHNTKFCIEPNPEAYNCDFITTAQQGIDLVGLIANPGFGLHLDAAGMTLSGDDPKIAITAAADYLHHFHISAPYLGPIEEAEVDHAAMAASLRAINYTGYVSIEMRPGDKSTNVERVTQAVKIAQKHYC